MYKRLSVAERATSGQEATEWLRNLQNRLVPPESVGVTFDLNAMRDSRAPEYFGFKTFNHPDRSADLGWSGKVHFHLGTGTRLRYFKPPTTERSAIRLLKGCATLVGLTDPEDEEVWGEWDRALRSIFDSMRRRGYVDVSFDLISMMTRMKKAGVALDAVRAPQLEAQLTSMAAVHEDLQRALDQVRALDQTGAWQDVTFSCNELPEEVARIARWDPASFKGAQCAAVEGQDDPMYWVLLVPVEDAERIMSIVAASYHTPAVRGGKPETLKQRMSLTQFSLCVGGKGQRPIVAMFREGEHVFLPELGECALLHTLGMGILHRNLGQAENLPLLALKRPFETLLWLIIYALRGGTRRTLDEKPPTVEVVTRPLGMTMGMNSVYPAGRALALLYQLGEKALVYSLLYAMVYGTLPVEQRVLLEMEYVSLPEYYALVKDNPLTEADIIPLLVLEPYVDVSSGAAP
jgi:hypothetical protein